MNARRLITEIMAGLFTFAVTIGSAGANDQAVTNLDGYGMGTVVGFENKNTVGFVSVTYVGEGNATVLGKFDFLAKLAVRWDTPMPNGSGGYCAPASGYSTHETSDKSTVVMNFTGTFCEASQQAFATETLPHMPAPPFTYTGTYLIVDGTGRFRGASGSGSITGSTDQNLKLTVIVDGKIFH